MSARSNDDDPPGPSDLATRSTTYPMSRLAPRFELVDIALEIQRADATLGLVTGAKLDLIRKQMRVLQDEARSILEDAERASLLHRARCNFQKRVGAVYHLYRKGDGERYFSMLAPSEWGDAPPHPFEGSYRLELDQTFSLVAPEGS
jgi:hypothetical protein